MCTNLTIQTGPGTLRLMSARTMDFGLDAPATINLVPRGTSFPVIPPAHNPLRWTNQYGFIATATGIPHLTVPYYSDGLNEKGLSAAELWLPGSEYAAAGSSSNPEIYQIDFAAWVLGNFATVAEVQQALSQISVIDIKNLLPVVIPVHFALSDATGAHCIIEYMGGTVQFYTSDTGLMTNAPAYDWQMTNLTNYINLSLTNSTTIWNGQEINGSGLHGVPGDATPPSRFVRASFMQQSTFVPTDEQQAVGLAMQVLQTCIVPYGTILSGTNQSDADHTQWGVIRDHKNLIYYFFTAFNNNLYRVNLAEIDFATAKARQIPIAQPNWFTDVTSSLTGSMLEKLEESLA